MLIFDKKTKVAIACCTIWGVSEIADAESTKVVQKVCQAVIELLPVYNQCATEFNHRRSAAIKICGEALAVSSDARKKYKKIILGEEKNLTLKKINAPLMGMENSLELIRSGLKNITAQTTQSAGGTGGSLSTNEPAFDSATTSKSYETAVVQFDPEQFDEATISIELENIRTSPSFPRIRLDAFSSGNVVPSLEQENASICGQWIEWLLRKQGENPLSIMSTGDGHIAVWDQDFQIYFPRELESTAAYPAYCIVGMIVTDAHDVWSSEDFSSWHVFMQPEGVWPESEITKLTQTLTDDFGILSMEIAGHADGSGT